MLQGYEIKFNIYAESEAEAEEARQAIIAFIASHAQQGRAVTGRKIAEAVAKWDKNPFVKNEIIKFFK
ncbi:MAG: hypothetical protein II793_05245 [Bacteroidales bacterium]|nr:hypothetical protein [Bacteroidales bacterium]